MPPTPSSGGYQTPPFRPTPYPPSYTSPLSTPGSEWKAVLSVGCHYPLSVFLSTLKTLTLHPERNTSFILRADPLPLGLVSAASRTSESDGVHRDELGRDHTSSGSQTQIMLGEDEVELVEQIRVRLMPRQPRRDGKLDQTTLFYRTAEDGHAHVTDKGKGRGDDGPKKEVGVVVTIPEVKSRDEVPYYHPPVREIAYVYESVPSASASASSSSVSTRGGEDQSLEENSEIGTDEVRGTISIHYLPFPPSAQDGESTSNLNADPQGLRLGPSASASARTRPIRRSPLAGPSISPNEHSDPPTKTKPPAIILPSEDSSLPTSTHPASTTDSSAGSSNPSQSMQASPQADERLYRTCLGMMDRLYKHGYGQLVGYTKRRVHDVIVPRDNFQDLYLVLKDRHKHLDSRAPRQGMSSKLEDVKRHVWKSTSLPSVLLSTDDPSLPQHSTVDLSEWGEQDVAIAAFLMLLWKDMYPARHRPAPGQRSEGVIELEEGREWDTWGRPEGGFVDLGCGNGILVHILISEGYTGKGYELRSRRTWPLYPTKTQHALEELPIDPPSWFPRTIEEWDAGVWEGKESCVVKENTFLIGNHSDELTPWLPLLSLVPSTPVPHLSLPCCLHTLDSSFDQLQFTAPEHPHTPQGGFENGLEPGVSRYKSYLVWLGWCGLQCGWEWEKEGLRVPSTKGWGIVARKRWANADDDRDCRIWALERVNEVRTRGSFKVREKEGKDH